MFDKIIEVILQFLDLFCFWFINADYEGSLVLRFGIFNRIAKRGFNWKYPFNIEKVLSTNIAIRTLRVEPQSIMTVDGKEIIISAVITYKVEDIKLFLIDVEGDKEVLDDSTFGIISEFVRSKTLTELIEINIANEISKKTRIVAKKYGVNVISVQLRDFTKSRSIRLIMDHNIPSTVEN